MSEPRPQRPPAARLMEVLRVRASARVGVAVGLLVAAAAYGVFVVLPERPAGRAALYLVLAAVVFLSTASLVTLGLTLRRLARLTMSPPKWIRRGGTAALVGGLGWTVLAAGAPVAGALEVPVGAAYARLVPALSATLVAGVWAVHAANRDRYGRHGLAGAALAGAGAVLAGWVGGLDPAALVTGTVTEVSRSLFLFAHGLLLLGSTVLGSAVLRAGPTEWRSPGLALLFVLPVALTGLALAALLGRPAATALALGGPPGLAWAAVGRRLRRGLGVPPADRFETDVDLDLDLDLSAGPEGDGDRRGE